MRPVGRTFKHGLLPGILVSAIVLFAGSTSADSGSVDDTSLSAVYARGAEYLSARRFNDAEKQLSGVLNREDAIALSLANRIIFYSVYEASLMHQGKSLEVKNLIDEKLELLRENDAYPSFAYATSLLNYAEAQYRLGDPESAIQTTRNSISMLEKLPRVDERVIAFAAANIDQFDNQPWQTVSIPLDLSEFFNRCEYLNNGDHITQVRRAFAEHIEVGKDFQVSGHMAEIFASALPIGVDRNIGESKIRTVFIPDLEHQSDWCIVYHRDDKVTNVIVSYD